MKPFKILGLQQIALGNLEKDSLNNLWQNLLGIPKVGSFRSEKENVDEDILSIGKGLYAVEVDLMMPVDAQKRPKVHEPALNHIGLWVDKLEECVNFLQQQGVRFTPGGIRKGAAGHNVCFIHPKGNDESPLGGCGVLIELIQAPSNIIEELI